ncbi:AbrB/MazE/SpoVT family DNA-binding domain-containing protein [Candidatus Woesearchaeota archaeon]|nr:AbrB/MazE/SpoVT family DNA-binding domain-containing protein [Candidatus Woesearchaeota archaeon]
MIECESNIRKWGNSFGIIIPKDIMEKEHIKEDEKVRFMIIRDSKVLKETFGMLKGRLRKSGQEIKDQTRKELYNE